MRFIKNILYAEKSHDTTFLGKPDWILDDCNIHNGILYTIRIET